METRGGKEHDRVVGRVTCGNALGALCWGHSPARSAIGLGHNLAASPVSHCVLAPSSGYQSVKVLLPPPPTSQHGVGWGLPMVQRGG